MGRRLGDDVVEARRARFGLCSLTVVTSSESRVTAAETRIEALDALRALTLLGVLVVNVDTQFARSPFASFVSDARPIGLDALAIHLVRSLLQERPLVVFSLLFGVGLSAGRAARRTRDQLRRLIVLFAFGVLHFVLLWSGDVLALYAIVGLAAALIVRLRLPHLWLFVLGLAAIVTSALPIPYPPPFVDASAMQSHVAAASAIYSNGTYLEIVRFRVAEAWPTLAISLWSVPRTLGLFLLGATLWNAGAFARAQRARLVFGSAVILALGLSVVALSDVLRGVSLAVALGVGEIAISLGGAGLLVAALDAPLARGARRALAPIGRMTLTSYLAQSVVLGFVFYGYGAGAFERVGHARGVALSLALFTVQLGLARVWLARFLLGPMEWLWRALSLGVRLPLRRPRT